MCKLRVGGGIVVDADNIPYKCVVTALTGQLVADCKDLTRETVPDDGLYVRP